MAELESVSQPTPIPRRTAGEPIFSLRFSADLIPTLASNYRDDDSGALDAGLRIAAGSRARADFMKIFNWKTRGRGRSRPASNDDAELADALELATAARTDRAAIAVLVGLSGVDIPVASAVMAMVKPHQFTIIDFRALWSLGVDRKAWLSIGYYLAYLAFCRKIAAAARTDLRTLDKALWQYSSENQPTRST